MEYTIIAQNSDDNKKEIQVIESKDEVVMTTTPLDIKGRIDRLDVKILNLEEERTKLNATLKGMKKDLKLKI